MRKNPNFYGLIAMFIAMLMIAALGPVNAKYIDSPVDCIQLDFDVGPAVQPEVVFTADVENLPLTFLDRGVSVPLKYPFSEINSALYYYANYDEFNDQDYKYEYKYLRPREGLRCGLERHDLI